MLCCALTTTDIQWPQIRRNGWTHPDPIRATKEVIAPVTVGLLGMVVLPAVGLWSIRKLLPLPFENDALRECPCDVHRNELR